LPITPELVEQAKELSKSSGVSLFRALNMLMVPILKDWIRKPDSLVRSALDVATAYWLDGCATADELLEMKVSIWEEIDALKRASRRDALLHALLCVLDPEPGAVVQDPDWEDMFEPEDEESVCRDRAGFMFEQLAAGVGCLMYLVGPLGQFAQGESKHHDS